MIIEENRFAGYDIIGDVHGCGHTLNRLLETLGYVKRGGVFEYSNARKPRQVIFVGDIVDRGPHIREALLTVHDMVQKGSARLIMGNHEYNALTYCTPARPGLGRPFLREHNERHTRLIRETLEQFDQHPGDWRDFMAWFLELPLFLEYEHFRVVHACWDAYLIEAFVEQRQSHCIDADFLHASVDHSTLASRVLDRLTRGVDMRLPQDEVMTSKDGFRRRYFRVNFWNDNPRTYGEIAFQPDPLPDHLAAHPLSESDRARLVHYGIGEKPLFFGHYWRSGTPALIRQNLACLDYSAVKYGKLVAYRMDAEPRLHNDKFVWIEVNPEQRGLG